MTVTRVTQTAQRTVHSISLEVTQEGANSEVVRVASGAFTCSRNGYTLDDDYLFTLTSDPARQTDVLAFLCWNKRTTKVEVVVDAAVAGTGAPYGPEQDPDRKGLYLLYACSIPPGMSDFSELVIRCFGVSDASSTNLERA